jgi:hypothetical protein
MADGPEERKPASSFERVPHVNRMKKMALASFGLSMD